MGTPAGPIKFLTTFELEPTADGTTVHMRFGAAKASRDRAILTNALPTFEGIFAANAASLRAQLAEELEARMSAAPVEPPVPAPKAGGLFSELEPLLLVG